MSRIVDWDGEHLPTGLRELPPGRYRIEPIGETVELTPEEEAGLEEALAAMDAGQRGKSIEEVRQELSVASRR
jgi:hypothetical protein